MIELNIFPPAIISTRKNGTDRWAKARGPWVSLPFNTSPHQEPHELAHVTQWYALTALSASALYIAHLYFALPIEIMGLSVGVHGGLYAVSKRYRFWAEAEAYRVSAKTSPQRIEEFAQMLYAYKTGRTLDQCRAALKAS